MEHITDWVQLWRQIVETQEKGRQNKGNGSPDKWAKRARGFHENVKKRWEQPDSSRTFIIDLLKKHPGSTVLDIGAGSGSWACQLASYAARVTALEPSPAMLAVMEENIKEQGVTNVEIVQDAWPGADLEEHDFSLCSHAMYGCADIETFFRKMHERTRRTCLLLMRVPTHDGLMAQIARHIWGQPYDSPDFQVGYNALLQMGLFPNVLMEDRGLWEPWVNASLEEAAKEVKGKLGVIEGDSSHDAYLENLLRAHLREEDGKVVWPRGVCSALVYWHTRA